MNCVYVTDFGLIGLFIYVRNKVVYVDSQVEKIVILCIVFTLYTHVVCNQPSTTFLISDSIFI